MTTFKLGEGFHQKTLAMLENYKPEEFDERNPHVELEIARLLKNRGRVQYGRTGDPNDHGTLPGTAMEALAALLHHAFHKTDLAVPPESSFLLARQQLREVWIHCFEIDAWKEREIAKASLAAETIARDLGKTVKEIEQIGLLAANTREDELSMDFGKNYPLVVSGNTLHCFQNKVNWQNCNDSRYYTGYALGQMAYDRYEATIMNGSYSTARHDFSNAFAHAIFLKPRLLSVVRTPKLQLREGILSIKKVIDAIRLIPRSA